MKGRGWFFNKRIDLARRFLKSDSGLRLLTRAMPDKIQHITIAAGQNRFAIRPVDSVARELLRKGNWFERETEHFIEFARQRLNMDAPRVGLEIGGHVGTQSVQIAQSGILDRLIAFEPQPENFNLLRVNLLMNEGTACVTPVQRGVGETAEELPVYTHPHNSGAGSLLPLEDGCAASSTVVKVEPVSTLLADLGIAPNDVVLLWLDAEGMEPDILKSCVQAGVRAKVAAIEFSPSAYGTEGTAAFLALLRAQFSEVWRLSFDGIVPFEWDALTSVTRQIDIVVVQ